MSELRGAWHALEFRKCAPDWEGSTVQEKLEAFEYFCSTYGSINKPPEGKIPFNLREAQVETVRTWLESEATVVLKARQVGFSTLVSIYCFWLAYFYPDRHIIMLSRTERESSKLLSHSKYLYQFLPEWFKLLGPVLRWTQKGVAMTNASALESMPSANDPARGSTAWLVIVDEIAFLPNSDQAWASIEPVTDVGGRVIMLSTANGEGNLFHKMWVGSQTKQGVGSNFTGIFFPWWAGDRDDAWYENKKAELPDWQLAQEYPSNPEEAFLKSGRPVFDLDRLRAMKMEEPDRGRLEMVQGSLEFVQDGGSFMVWEYPDSRGVYVLGADVAFGLEHGDASSVHVIEARSGTVVAAWHGRVDPDIFGDTIIPQIGRWYNNCLVGVENNNQGLATVRALQRAKYPNQYVTRQLATKKRQATQQLGWHTDRQSKAVLVAELNKALRDEPDKGGILLLDDATVAELRTFVREGDGRTHGSPHDDRVMSLGIAVQMLKYVWLPEYKPKKALTPGTWGWKMKELFGEEPRKGAGFKRIGEHAVRKSA